MEQSIVASAHVKRAVETITNKDFVDIFEDLVGISKSVLYIV